MSVLNKNNYGFITPTDFNLYAKQAQLDLFEDYFFKYNEQIVKQNARRIGSGIADTAKGQAEVISRFTLTETLEPLIDGANTINEFFLPEDFYRINKLLYTNPNGRVVEIERIDNFSATEMFMSNLTQPISLFPVYVQEGIKATVHPNTINQPNVVKCNYIRYPRDPKWTWVVLQGNAPLFNQTASDFQDFELPLHDEPRLVAKILQYAGVNIREAEVVQFANQEEQKDLQINR